MSDHPIILDIPDHIYNRARQIADAANCSVEEILLRRLEEVFSTADLLTKREYTLEKLLDGITPDNLHGEIDSGSIPLKENHT